MMAVWGGIEVLLLLGLGAAGTPSDLVSLIDPESYFRSRQVPVTVEKMLELAGGQPSDAKGQVARLLAIRMLGEDPEDVKKEKEAIVKVLEPIAGRSDGLGFADAYARRTLHRLGAKIAPGNRGADGQLVQGLQWFPDKVTFVAGAGRLDDSPSESTADNRLRDFIKSSMPPQALDEMVKFAEAVGNIRIDRFVFGYAPDPQQGKGRVFIRVSGAVHHKWLLDYIRKSLPPGMNVKDDLGTKAEPVSMIDFGGNGPAIALVGNTDVIVAGYAAPQGNHREALEEVIKMRAGKKASILKGALAAELEKVSPQAVGLLLGDVPAEIRQPLLVGGPFTTLPQRVGLEVTRALKGKGDLEIQFRGKFDNANAAKAFSESVTTLQKQGVAFLKNPPPLPPGAKLPAKVFDLMRTSLEGLRIEAKGDGIAGSAQVSGELVSLLPIMGAEAFTLRGEMPMPKAPQAIPKAVEKR
jgi:hypothetical protein